MHANKKGRSSYRGASTGRGGGVFYPLLYYMPIALRFSSEYPANRVTARPRRNNGEDGGEGKGEGSPLVGSANGRKLFSSNWHRGLRRGRRRIIFSH